MSYEKTIAVLFYENGIEVKPFADLRMEQTANGFEIKIAPYDKVANNIGSVAFDDTYIISRNPPQVMVITDDAGNKKKIINVSGGKTPQLVEEDNIVLITTHDRNFSKIVLSIGCSVLTNLGLDKLEALLPKDKFCRVHKSFIISRKYIKEVGEPPRRKITMADFTTIIIYKGYEKIFVIWY